MLVRGFLKLKNEFLLSRNALLIMKILGNVKRIISNIRKVIPNVNKGITVDKTILNKKIIVFILLDTSTGSRWYNFGQSIVAYVEKLLAGVLVGFAANTNCYIYWHLPSRMRGS